MTLEQRLAAAKLLAGNDGIVCFVANEGCGLTCGLESAKEDEILYAFSQMYSAIVDAANGLYNAINGTKFPHEHTERLLRELSEAFAAKGRVEMSIRATELG